jgi:hypothetical protein
MKTLLILRGPDPDSPKRKEWIETRNLQPYMCSPNDIRKLYGSPLINSKRGDIKYGGFDDEDMTWKFYDALTERMKKGCAVVVSGEFLKFAKLKKLKDLAKIYGYHVFVKNFPIEPDIMTRLEGKEFHAVSPVTQDTVMSDIKDYLNSWDALKNSTASASGVTMISDVQDIVSYFETRESCKLPDTTELVFVGDIHGYYDKISKYVMSECCGGSMIIPENQFWVFLGDYIDRGPEPKKCLDFVMTLAQINRGNVVALEGNHEQFLKKYLATWNDPRVKDGDIKESPVKKIRCEQFLDTTMADYIGLEAKERSDYLERMGRVLQDSATILRGGVWYYCSHAGFYSLKQFGWKLFGNCMYGNRDVEDQDKWASKELGNDFSVSVHAHCKYPGHPGTHNLYPSVYNLDPGKDGEIRVLRIPGSGGEIKLDIL